MGEAKLVLFELANILNGFWAKSGSRVQRWRKVVGFWWMVILISSDRSSDGDSDTKSMMRWVEADIACTKVWMCSGEAMSRDLVSGYKGAEYESEAEERVRWLFIEMRKSALLRCGPAPETSPVKLQ